MKPIDELRRATQALHDRLDQSPYAGRVMDGSLRLEDYAAFLASLVVIHEALEAAAKESREPAVQSLWSPESRALPALAKDLEHLAALGVEVAVPPAAFELAGTIRQLSEHDPGALAGVLYVLEGSKLGGVVQAAALSKVPALHERGREYLAGTGAHTRGAFRQFLTRLDTALKDDVAPAVRGAVATFEGFEAIVRAASSAGTNPHSPA
jgi:heme oxygenase